MERKGLALTIGIAAILAVAGMAAASAAAPEACARWCEPLRLYQEVLALPAEERSLDRIAGAAAGLGYTLEVLVALIPDPQDAGMAYRSDEALEAIQRGFADTNHLFDRQWLPWEGEAAQARRYRREPGALLFRRSADARGGRVLTLVLLVGETPKSGVHRAALREALDLAAEVQRAAGVRGPLRVLGPSFSGSVESLRIALHAWLAPPAEPPAPAAPPGPRVHLVSGSATAPGLEESFDREFGGAVRLERTLLPDDRLTCRAFSYLRDKLGWDFQHAALLSEFDTGYGQEARRRVRAPAARADDPCETAPRPAYLLEFPSHLARLRAAREKEGLQPKPAAPVEGTASGRRTLDPDDARAGNPVDAMPQFDSLTTASADLVLAQQLQALCREGVRYVGLLATDLQDRLFLAEHVRTYCPDALLFTFDNHLLDGHPRYTRAMEGSLVLTSFPLYVAANQQGYRRLPASAFQQGVLLAVRQLLLRQPETRPRPWIVAVGRGGLWPLARLEERQTRPFTIAGTEGVAFKWVAACAVIALLAVWLWVSARPFLAGGRVPSGGPGIRLLVLTGLGTLGLASGVLLVFYSLPLWSREDFLSERGLLWGTNLTLLAVVYSALVFGGARLLRPAFHLAPLARTLVWLAGAVVLLLALRQAALALWVLPEGAEFFYARAGDFGSGLSPLVPLACLLAAVYAGALLELRRRRLILVQEVAWPLSAAAGVAEQPLATCGRRARQLDRSLWDWLPGLWFWLGLAFAFAIPARRLLDLQPVAEPALYGLVFLGLVALCFTLGALAFHRFYTTWRRLEGILDLLCHTWLHAAFHQSAASFDWKPLRSFGWRMPPHKLSLLAVQELKALARLGALGPEGAALAGPDGALDRTLGALFDAERQRDVESEIRLRRSLQGRLAATAHRVERERGEPGAPEARVREIEKYLAVRVVTWLRYVFAHLRSALLTTLACGLFVLIGVSAYAFQPKQYLSFGVWAALLIASALTLRIFLRMDRNVVLSAIAGTDGGKVSFDRTFFANLFTYVGIPVTGVVLTQFPAVGSLLGDLLQPLLRLLAAG